MLIKISKLVAPLFLTTAFLSGLAPADAAVTGDGRTCTIVGTARDDVLRGTAGKDVICGRGGDDRLEGRGGNDVLDGGGGADQLLAGDGKDTLLGGSGNDELVGGLGSDRLTGATGDDTLTGSAGSDTTSFTDETAGVSVDLQSAAATGNITGTDSLQSIENVIGGAGTDLLIGNGAGNRLDGGAGADQVQGLGGNDILYGGAGQDMVTGGTEDDKLSGGADPDEVDGGEGINICSPGSGDTTVAACELTVVFALDQVALLKGTVHTAAGLAVPGIRLNAVNDDGSSSVTTAPDGTFAMAVIKGSGLFRLTDDFDNDPWYPSYRQVGLPGEFSLAMNLRVAHDMDLPITLPPAHPVTVTVTNGDGEPLSGASITTPSYGGLPLDALWPGGPALVDAWQHPAGSVVPIWADAQGRGTFHAFETSRMRADIRYYYGAGLTLTKSTPLFSVRNPKNINAVL